MQITVRTHQSTPNLRVVLHLLDPTGFRFAFKESESDVGGWTAFFKVYLGPGEDTLRVEGQPAATGLFQLTFEKKELSGCVFAWVPLGVEIDAELSAPGSCKDENGGTMPEPVANFFFSALEGRSVTIALAQQDSLANTVLRVTRYDPGTGGLSVAYTTNGLTRTATFTPSSGHDYYLEVRDLARRGGGFTLIVKQDTLP